MSGCPNNNIELVLVHFLQPQHAAALHKRSLSCSCGRAPARVRRRWQLATFVLRRLLLPVAITTARTLPHRQCCHIKQSGAPVRPRLELPRSKLQQNSTKQTCAASGLKASALHRQSPSFYENLIRHSKDTTRARVTRGANSFSLCSVN